MEKVDCVVVGAGVIGLAIARQLSQQQGSCLILDAETQFGSQTSSRNSEVIHAGIYYPRGSLKAQLCVEGNKSLYEYCKTKHIEHKKIGKLIVASQPSQIPQLEDIKRHALNNGVEDLIWLDQQKLRQMEPDVRGCAALFSPSTGIIDSHELMLGLLSDIEKQGGQLVCQSQVENIRVMKNGFKITGTSQGQPFEILSKILINAAGLGAQHLAKNVQAPDKIGGIPELHLCKGNYFSLQESAPFKHLIYPIPEANTAGLGIHATLNLSGQVRFGPDTQTICDIDYQVDEQQKPKFIAAIKRYYPQINPDNLVPDYSGIRPKLSRPGQPARDFVIQGPKDHGIGGMVQLFGIESPGLTSCLAIGKYVESLLTNK